MTMRLSQLTSSAAALLDGFNVEVRQIRSRAGRAMSSFSYVMVVMLGLSMPSHVLAKDEWAGIKSIEWRSEDGAFVSVQPTSKGGKILSEIMGRWASCLTSDKDLNLDKVFSVPAVPGVIYADSLSKIGPRKNIEVCLGKARGVTLSNLQVDILLGDIAQDLYLKNFATMPVISGGSLVNAVADPNIKPFLDLLRISDCFVQFNGAAADELVRTQRGSVEEYVAFYKFSPLFSKCLRRTDGYGGEVAYFRSMIAQSLYRRAKGYTEPGSDRWN